MLPMLLLIVIIVVGALLVLFLQAAQEEKPKEVKLTGPLPPLNLEQCDAEEAAVCWANFSEESYYFLAIYHKGKEQIVDVLAIIDAEPTNHKIPKLNLLVVAPKVVNDKYIGKYLEWEKEFTLPLEKLIYFEPLGNDFHDDNEMKSYKSVVEHGLSVANKRQCESVKS